MREAAARAEAARAAGVLFELSSRAVAEVAGGDRVRWLDGMVTGDVKALDPAGARSGCHALALTREGRIVAEVHVLARADRLLLETDRAAVEPLLAHLARYVVADDVRLADASDAFVRLALEGPAAAEVLVAAAGAAPALAPDGAAEVALAGAPVLVAAYGLSGLPGGIQLLAPAARAAAVRDALLVAGAARGVGAAGAETLELLRVEEGVPRFGCELGPDVLPAEARLAHAVSTTKGCYTGQEVVTRMRSRGRVSHLLVGLRLESAGVEPGAELRAGERAVGHVTSVVESARHGPIGLGFVRAAEAEPGTALRAGGVAARVAALPFAAA